MEPNNKSLRRPALGRGLAALIPQAPAAEANSAVLQLAIERIQPERGQPRKRFDDTALGELAASIRERGVLQPILVRRSGSDYRIIAGERRWRAAQRAGLLHIPALVRDLGDQAAFEVALVENLQREDLDPLEEAEAYRHLCEGQGLTQEEAAARVGKDRSTVANAMRLLRLPSEVRESLARGDLEMGHARALLSIQDEARLLKLARAVTERRLSVREVERLVREQRHATTAVRDRGTATLRHEEEALERALGTRVRVHARGGRGRIELRFSSHEEFARLSELLRSKAGRS
ncbi:MAG: ParB/RepB/Spo0J family partition protein [Myxococcales bacterium]